MNVPVIIGTIPLREQFGRFHPMPASVPNAPFVEPGAGDDANPSAPPLFSHYPDLRKFITCIQYIRGIRFAKACCRCPMSISAPPSYEHATRFDDNLPEYDQVKDNGDAGGQGSTFDPSFVPKYPIYGWT